MMYRYYICQVTKMTVKLSFYDLKDARIPLPPPEPWPLYKIN